MPTIIRQNGFRIVIYPNDLGVPQLVAGLFGTKAWMAQLGRQGGKSRSGAKAQASRDNGKHGGRPRKPLSSESNSDELLNREV